MLKANIACLVCAFLFNFTACKKDSPKNSASFNSDEDTADPVDRSGDTPVSTLWNEGVALFERAGIKTFTRPDDQDNLKIAYTLLKAEPFSGFTVLIVPGFSESHFKYSELAARLVRNGFNVVAINLRGMGYSERFPKPANMGSVLHGQVVHLRDLNDYAKDINHLINRELKGQIDGKVVAFAHSTGGLAVTEFMAEWPGAFSAVVLNSPLFGINMKWYQAAISNVISPINPEAWPTVGSQTPWEASTATFEGQTDSTSKERWHLYNQFLSSKMHIAQAFASRGWIAEVKKHTTDQNLTLIAKAFRVPTLLLQAGKDSYVDIDRQNFIKSQLDSQLPEAKNCLRIWPFSAEYHSIWRGISHEPVFKEVLMHFLKTKDC